MGKKKKPQKKHHTIHKQVDTTTPPNVPLVAETTPITVQPNIVIAAPVPTPNFPILKPTTIFDKPPMREKEPMFTRPPVQTVPNTQAQIPDQGTNIPILIPEQKDLDWFARQQSLPKVPFWHEKNPRIHDLEAEINNAHFHPSSESEDNSDRVILDPNNALKDHVYQLLDRQGIFLPAFTSNAITIEALENHSHPDFFFILKSDAIVHEDKDHRFRFKLNFVLNILQHFTMETQGKRMLPYLSVPDKFFLSIIAYHLDPKDALKLRPKEKPKHEFTIKIQQATGTLRNHNQVPQITQLYKHVDQIQNTLNIQKSKEIDTVAQYSDLQEKAKSKLTNVNSFLNEMEPGISHQLRDTVTYKNLLLFSDISVTLRDMAKRQDVAAKDVLKQFGSDNLIRAYDQSLLKKPTEFYTVIKEKPTKDLNTNATLATVDLHDIYIKQGHRYLLAFLKRMHPDHLTEQQNLQLNNIKNEYRGAVEVQRETIRQQLTLLRTLYIGVTKGQRKIARKFDISCGQSRNDLERLLQMLPEIKNLDKLHKVRSMAEFHEDNWKKITAESTNKINFELAPKETVNIEIESLDDVRSGDTGRTRFDIEGNMDDPFEAFEKIDPLRAFKAPSPGRAPSPDRLPQARNFFDKFKGFVGFK